MAPMMAAHQRGTHRVAARSSGLRARRHSGPGATHDRVAHWHTSCEDPDICRPQFIDYGGHSRVCTRSPANRLIGASRYRALRMGLTGGGSGAAEPTKGIQFFTPAPAFVGSVPEKIALVKGLVEKIHQLRAWAALQQRHAEATCSSVTIFSLSRPLGAASAGRSRQVGANNLSTATTHSGIHCGLFRVCTTTTTTT